MPRYWVLAEEFAWRIALLAEPRLGAVMTKPPSFHTDLMQFTDRLAVNAPALGLRAIPLLRRKELELWPSISKNERKQLAISMAYQRLLVYSRLGLEDSALEALQMILISDISSDQKADIACGSFEWAKATKWTRVNLAIFRRLVEVLVDRKSIKNALLANNVAALIGRRSKTESK